MNFYPLFAQSNFCDHTRVHSNSQPAKETTLFEKTSTYLKIMASAQEIVVGVSPALFCPYGDKCKFGSTCGGAPGHAFSHCTRDHTQGAEGPSACRFGPACKKKPTPYVGPSGPVPGWFVTAEGVVFCFDKKYMPAAGSPPRRERPERMCPGAPQRAAQPGTQHRDAAAGHRPSTPLQDFRIPDVKFSAAVGKMACGDAGVELAALTALCERKERETLALITQLQSTVTHLREMKTKISGITAALGPVFQTLVASAANVSDNDSSDAHSDA